MADNLFSERIRLANDAIAHKEPDRIPIWINFGTTPHMLYGDDDHTYKNVLYDHEKAAEAIIKFHEDFQPDIQLVSLLSGEAEETAGTQYIDWPGKPGTRVPDTSIYQCREFEFLEQDEYPEFLRDFTGFMLHKYIPRAFPNLAGLSKMLNPAPVGYMYAGQLASLYREETLDALEKLIKIGRLEHQNDADVNAIRKILAEKGFPPMFSGVGMVPYDILANYFRGTMGIFDDLMECPEHVAAAVDMLTDLQIANVQYFRYANMPVKRVMFWMHKGMDGFMSPDMFEELYWRPFVKILNALVEMDVTPIIYTEGSYKTRLAQMTDIPVNKCVVHFEKVDLEEAKKTIGQSSCITGNFPIYLLEHGTVQQVVDEAKRQIDIGAPGGGFIFETDASIEIVKRENLEALYDTVREYGRK